MTRTAYKVLAIIFAVIAVIGLISFIGGVRAVNIGAFVFPLILAIVSFVLYRRKQ